MGGNSSSATGESGNTSDFDAIVMGAGISGLVSASLLLEQGSTRILVVDEYNHVGGNHIDCTREGYTFDVGSFIFQDDSPLLRHFPELLPLYVPIEPSWGKLNPQGKVTQYPFSVQDDFISAGPIECCRILLSASFARLRRRRMRNARDFAQYWIGARLMHRSGLENYMERFCGFPAERIDLKFAQKRMLWIAEHATLTNVFRRLMKPSTDQPTNRQLARPREGFAHLYRPAVQRLQARGVTFLLGAELKSLDKVGPAFQLQVGEHRFAANRVVSTIPVDRLRDLCGMPPEKPLPAVTLISLFFSFSGERGFEQYILYNFSHDGEWKRLTMYSDVYGQFSGREFFSVEVIAEDVLQPAELAAQNFRRHTSENALFAGDLRLVGSHALPQAYPIYTEGSDERAERSIAALRAFGIESFGRQGGFQYQPTSRVSTLEAEAALRQS